MSAGKGSKPRNNASAAFRDNYAAIDWRTSTRIQRTLEKYLDVIEANIRKFPHQTKGKR